MRTIAGVLIGYAVWTGIWLGGNAAFFGEAADAVAQGEKYSAAGPLAAVIALSALCSLVAGFVTARIAKPRGHSAVLIMATLLLVTGIAVQASAWELMPLWYHLTFLMLLFPIAIVGGRLAPQGH